MKAKGAGILARKQQCDDCGRHRRHEHRLGDHYTGYRMGHQVTLWRRRQSPERPAPTIPALSDITGGPYWLNIEQVFNAGIESGYGEVQVLWGIDLDVAVGETVLLLGANGVGKATILRTVIGLLPCWSGEILFEGEPLQTLKSVERISRGIAFMLELGVFPDLSIAENIRLGGYFLGNAEVRRRSERLFTVFPDLAERRRAAAASLSGGQRKMLAIAKVLVFEPKLVLMDEPSAGLAPIFVKQVIEILKTVLKTGAALLIAEQNVAFLALGDRGVLIEGGRIRLSGTPAELAEADAVKAAYFGLD